ncbi:MAG: histidine phosphatase family protein [Ilumatobacter sp.]|uniref:histidine phosphatase family protein n=1 Tax=Ilumatobacter sp. TaxID=1967498 RepID=UPI0032999E00
MVDPRPIDADADDRSQSSSADRPTESGGRTTITLIRHGESMVTVERIIGGKRTCRGLTPLGRRQAEQLRDRLDREGAEVDALITTDFPRALETAEIVRPALVGVDASPEIEQWPDLGEHDPGPEIDGMTFDAYVERYGTPDWAGDRDIDIFPGGETLRRFHERVERGLAALCSEFAGRHVAVVCHGGVVDAVFRILLGVPMAGGFELRTLNTAITSFSGPSSTATSSAPGSWRLDRYNDAAHLVGLPAATVR